MKAVIGAILAFVATASSAATYECEGQSRGNYKATFKINGPVSCAVQIQSLKVKRGSQLLVTASGPALQTWTSNGVPFARAEGDNNYAVTLQVTDWQTYCTTDAIVFAADLDIAGGDDNEEEDSLEVLCHSVAG